MLYTAYSLNGTWEMDYSADTYTSEIEPFKAKTEEVDLAGTEPENLSMSIVREAVPGYWEDMIEKFRYTPFFCRLLINPEYGIQSYPIAGNPPDMALPNIMGNFYYRRSILIDSDTKNAVIHFDGVMNSVSVWINDSFIGRHCGYSAPFDFEIPDGILKNGVNSISLSVSNERLKGYENEKITGLTSRAANEFSGGITGNIEIRLYRCPLRDFSVCITSDTKNADVSVIMQEACAFNWELADGNTLIKSGGACGDFRFDTDGLERWSPENPKLYTLRLSVGEYSAELKFGVRRLTADKAKISLNGNAYYLRGACEHGYYPETVHPTHDKKFYVKVIKTLKKLGFNYIRFHTYIPPAEYLQAADELGILIQVECPNNTTLEEWTDIVEFCKKFTSVVIYCCGNELLLDEPFIEYIKGFADLVHSKTDSLFAPMSAMRGVEYFWCEANIDKNTAKQPFKHHPGRLKILGEFCDLYCSYPNGAHSYFSLDGNSDEVDECSKVYGKPRLSHEICIDGTYTDLSMKERYHTCRIGKTDMFTSIEKHLSEEGVLEKTPIYFRNSSQWQRRIRKYCFENVRKSDSVSGYDFLGPIDTHWHTFGYDVGMMNEFYELKPGETVKNVLRYNNDAVLLNDINKNVNYISEGELKYTVSVSNYKSEPIKNGVLETFLYIGKKMYTRMEKALPFVENGTLSELGKFEIALPAVKKPKAMVLKAKLSYPGGTIENEWELYLFPKPQLKKGRNTVIAENISKRELISFLEKGKNVLLIGAAPFKTLPTTYRISLAGRTSGNAATVINSHPIFKNFPHEGYCGWQFSRLLEGGAAVCFECKDIPFDPIVEVVSTHKYVIKQAALFEISAINGKLVVCGFNFNDADPAAQWLKYEILKYMDSDEFSPQNNVSKKKLLSFLCSDIKSAAVNKNFAFNQNDKTAVRKNSGRAKQ